MIPGGARVYDHVLVIIGAFRAAKACKLLKEKGERPYLAECGTLYGPTETIINPMLFPTLELATDSFNWKVFTLGARLGIGPPAYEERHNVTSQSTLHGVDCPRRACADRMPRIEWKRHTGQ